MMKMTMIEMMKKQNKTKKTNRDYHHHIDDRFGM